MDTLLGILYKLKHPAFYVLAAVVMTIAVTEKFRIEPLRDRIDYLEEQVNTGSFDVLTTRHKDMLALLKQEYEDLEEEQVNLSATLDSLQGEVDFFIKLVKAYKAMIGAQKEFLKTPSRLVSLQDSSVSEEARLEIVMSLFHAVRDSIESAVGMPLEEFAEYAAKKLGLDQLFTVDEIRVIADSLRQVTTGAIADSTDCQELKSPREE